MAVRNPVPLSKHTSYQFFAYGIFKPDQLGFNQIEEYMCNFEKKLLIIKCIIGMGVLT